MRLRWKDSFAFGIEGTGGGVGDGVAREYMCTRTCMCKRHSSASNRHGPDIGLCCYAICMYCTAGDIAEWQCSGGSNRRPLGLYLNSSCSAVLLHPQKAVC